MYGAEREEVSESWQHTYDLSSTMIPNVSTATDVEEHFCKHILYKEIQNSRYIHTCKILAAFSRDKTVECASLGEKRISLVWISYKV